MTVITLTFIQWVIEDSKEQMEHVCKYRRYLLKAMYMRVQDTLVKRQMRRRIAFTLQRRYLARVTG